jgi:hypothetical protein
MDGIPSHFVYGRDSVDIVWRRAVVSALNESLPVNSTDRTRMLLRLNGSTRNDNVVGVGSVTVTRLPISGLFGAIGQPWRAASWTSCTRDLSPSFV